MPAHQRLESLTQPDISRGKGFADWRDRVRQHWGAVRIEKVEVTPQQVKVGDDLTVRALVDLGALEPNDVNVQIYYGTLDSRNQLIAGEAVNMKHCGKANGASDETVHEFCADLSYYTTGKRGLSVRVLPQHPDLADPFQTGLITWASS